MVLSYKGREATVAGGSEAVSHVGLMDADRSQSDGDLTEAGHLRAWGVVQIHSGQGGCHRRAPMRKFELTLFVHFTMYSFILLNFRKRHVQILEMEVEVVIKRELEGSLW